MAEAFEKSDHSPHSRLHWIALPRTRCSTKRVARAPSDKRGNEKLSVLEALDERPHDVCVIARRAGGPAQAAVADSGAAPGQLELAADSVGRSVSSPALDAPGGAAVAAHGGWCCEAASFDRPWELILE